MEQQKNRLTPSDDCEDLGRILFKFRFPFKAGVTCLVLGILMTIVAIVSFHGMPGNHSPVMLISIAVLFGAGVIFSVLGIHYLLFKANVAYMYREQGATRKSGQNELTIRYKDAADFRYSIQPRIDKMGSWMVFSLDLTDAFGRRIVLNSAWKQSDAAKRSQVLGTIQHIKAERGIKQ
jgi:hypothetical protein